MARLFSCGFELQSVTAGVEIDNLYGPTVDTSFKRSGAASFKITGAITTMSSSGFDHQFSSGSTQVYARWYFYITALDNNASVAAYFDLLSGATSVISCQVSNVGGTYSFTCYYNNFAASLPQAPTTTTGAWHYIEVQYDTTPANGSEIFKVRLDGVEVASATNLNFTVKTINTISTGIFNGTAGTVSGSTINYDDMAVNDAAAGTGQTSYPGAGSIVHLWPVGAGDNNSWQTSAGGAGSSTNWQAVDEVPPDDATTYLKRIATTVKVDDFTVTAPATAGIGASDTISLVAVGVRGGAISATVSTDRDVLLRIKSAAAGTTVKSASSVNRLNVNGWVTHAALVPRVHKLVQYTDPTTAAAWTVSGTNSLTNMQIGIENQTSVTTEVRYSTLWALVEYVPAVSTAPVGKVLAIRQAVNRAGTY